ncbi:hypothetical protein GCM10009409_21460 [Shewanella saliphila]|uniref:Uncharacterized protein n=1 Tax=Shewanella saliphila TaxID=2282698 RepID=A0ABQ2Q843_9GAMM|nr:hypothetical protein GCM10009409_21460 [Shewanella saliphila]
MNYAQRYPHYGAKSLINITTFVGNCESFYRYKYAPSVRFKLKTKAQTTIKQHAMFTFNASDTE